MTDEERLIKEYGITCEQKTIYSCHGHKYEKLKDALAYARIQTERKVRERDAMASTATLKHLDLGPDNQRNGRAGGHRRR